MRKFMPAALLAAFLLMACMVAPGRRGEGVVLVPALPSIVILEEDPYYYQGGYHYFHQNDRWHYSNSRSGPWVELPRDRYPKEVKFKYKDKGKGKDDERGRGERRENDDRDRHR